MHNGDDAVIVLVSDAGPGITDPEAAMARGRGSGSAGSTGLGLDIVRRLAESTGGDVRIGSSVLGGTEIRIRLQLDDRAPCGAATGGGDRGRCAAASPAHEPDPWSAGQTTGRGRGTPLRCRAPAPGNVPPSALSAHSAVADGRVPLRAARPYQRALDFGVRVRVA